MAELILGQTFDNQQEAEEFVASFCARNYHPVRQRHNVTVTSYNKKVAPDSRLPEELKYQQMHWECKHFGVFKGRGNNKRDFQRVLPKECKFQISVTYNRLQCKFVVTTAVLVHENHEVSESIYPLYASHRKPNTEQMPEVDNMLLTNANPTLVAAVLHKDGVPVRVKDLYNRKQKLMKCGNDVDEAVQSALNNPQVISRIITDEQNKFEILFFQTSAQRKLFANFSEVIQMDATYKTNNMRYPLYTLLVVDNSGIGQPIAFGILAKEDQQHIEKFLEIFKELNDVTNLQCVIVDKDMAEINALRKQLPTTYFQICYFHILKAVDKYLSSLKLANEEECSQKFDFILQSNTEDDFSRQMTELASLSPSFYEYVVLHWLPFKENITLFGRKDVMHLQNRTNNHIESFHNVLKKVTSSSRISLDCLITKLLSLVAVRSYESVHRNFDMQMKTVVSTNPDVQNYYGLFTDYATSLIGKEIEKAHSRMYRILDSTNGKVLVRNEELHTIYEVCGYKCSCNMPTNMGLPCRHIIATWKMKGETLFQPNCVAKRWKRDLDVDVPSSSLPSTSTTAADFPIASTSHVQRFNTAMVPLKDLASYVAEQPRDKFGDFMKAINLFQNLITAGNCSALVDTLQTLNNATNATVQISSLSTLDTSSTALQLPPGNEGIVTNNSRQLAPVVEEVLANAPLSINEIQLDSPRASTSATLQCTKVLFRPIAKSRGRPPQSRARAFKIRGRKPTKVSEVMSLQGQVADEDMVQDVNTDVCYECMQEDPPKNLSRSKITHWLECTGSCGRWFHNACVKRKGEDMSRSILCSTCRV